MFSALVIIAILPIADIGKSRGSQFRPLIKIVFFVFVANFICLDLLGAMHVETPFIEIGQLSTIIYFLSFIVVIPAISVYENTLVYLHLNNNIIK